MSNEKKIKVNDTKKWLIKVFISMAVFMLVALIIFVPLANADKIGIGWIIILLFALFGYIIFAFKNSSKYVSVTEYREMSKNYGDDYLIKQLTKQNFSDEEIEDILKGRPVSNAIASQQGGSFTVDDELKETFIISNRLLTKAGLGILVDSKGEEIAIIQPNKDIQYIKFNQIHSYNVNQSEVGAGNGAMAFASLTGNDTLYKLGMANTVSGNKNIYAYVIQLVLNDVDASNIDIHILHKKMLNNSVEYSEIDNVGKSITSFLDKIISRKENASTKSSLREIKELKELLDMDAITKEEYEKKKKELLK